MSQSLFSACLKYYLPGPLTLRRWATSTLPTSDCPKQIWPIPEVAQHPAFPLHPGTCLQKKLFDRTHISWVYMIWIINKQLRMFCFFNTKRTFESSHSEKEIVCFAFNLIRQITDHLLHGDGISDNYIESPIAASSRHWIQHWYQMHHSECKDQGFSAGVCLEKLKLTQRVAAC